MGCGEKTKSLEVGETLRGRCANSGESGNTQTESSMSEMRRQIAINTWSLNRSETRM